MKAGGMGKNGSKRSYLDGQITPKSDTCMFGNVTVKPINMYK
jgi:hypothetical protein